MTPTKISRLVELTNAFQTIHTVDAHRWLTVKLIHLVNFSGVDASVDVCYVAPGSTATVSNSILWQYVIPANDFIELAEGDILEPRWAIRAEASANDSIAMKLAGIEDV